MSSVLTGRRVGGGGGEGGGGKGWGGLGGSRSSLALSFEECRGKQRKQLTQPTG